MLTKLDNRNFKKRSFSNTGNGLNSNEMPELKSTAKYCMIMIF